MDVDAFVNDFANLLASLGLSGVILAKKVARYHRYAHVMPLMDRLMDVKLMKREVYKATYRAKRANLKRAYQTISAEVSDLFLKTTTLQYFMDGRRFHNEFNVNPYEFEKYWHRKNPSNSFNVQVTLPTLIQRLEECKFVISIDRQHQSELYINL